MVVARELITRLAFQFDRSQLDVFERSIAGFKNSVVLTAGDIAKAVTASFDFFQNLAQSRIALKDIADFSGIATEDFLSMRLAAQELGVKTNTFDTAVKNLSKNLKLARVGAGPFLTFMQQAAGGVRQPFSTDNLKNFQNALEDIFTVVSNIADKSEQLRVLQNIFQTDETQTAELLRLIDQGLPKFIEFLEKNREAAAAIASQETAALKLQQQIDRMNTSWTKFSENILGAVLPTITLLVTSFNDAFDAISTVTDYIIKAPKRVFNFATETIPDLTRQAIANFESNIHPPSAQPAQSITANTTINIDVPPGTTQEQTSYIAENLREAIQQVIDQNARQIISSNPMVE